MKSSPGPLLLAFVSLAAAGPAAAAPRDVQIRSIDLRSQVVELFNFGDTDEPLAGYRFCTHDENEIRQYSLSTGLNGLTIEAGTSLFIHFNNDAPGGSDTVNRSALGEFALPLDAGPYGMQLYFPPVNFFDGNTIADHLQWSVSGLDDVTADERSDEAQNGGVWVDQNMWIATRRDTIQIVLTDPTGAVLHGPDDYAVVSSAQPLDDPIPGTIPPSTVHVRLETIATGLTAPNWGAAPPGLPGQLVATDQDGILWRIDLATGDRSVMLDVSKRLVPLGIFGPGSFDERGLLGVAFHPDFKSNGLLYTYTSEPANGPADFTTMPPGSVADHQSVIAEWRVPDPSAADAVVDPASARVLLRIDQPQFNHNAGALNFGPDGLLYASLGDGGGADDQDGQMFFGTPIIGHGSTGNGRDPANILGTIIRIDPLGTSAANGRYGIPADNPFAGAGDSAVDEIYAFGFRNPFRFSFDMLTGGLYLADVGQNDIEEIDIVTAGGNYGWNFKEGSFFFEPNGFEDGFVTKVDPGVPPGLIDPIAEYDHDEGIAVVGGFVYRGIRIPALEERYVFGDFARTFNNDGRLFHLDAGGQIVEFALLGQSALGLSLLGMGQDANGEVYVLANGTGTPFGDTGVVLRIAPKIGDLDADGETDRVDLLVLLGEWGQTGSPADLDLDGTVGIIDLLRLLANFG